MDLIKLLDVSSPKSIKNVINTLITEYKNVAENFPTKLSDLTDDETHRLVTDTEKASWNAKLSVIPNDYKTKTENDNLYQPKGNYLTSFTESDPTVPAWAKQSNKPEYEYSEIKNTPVIPINNNQLTNGAGYITATRPAGQGIGFISKDNAGFTIYGDSVSENLYTYIINSGGKNGWYKLLDTNGKLYSEHKEVAVKEDIPIVNNSTITIKQGEETKGSFTLNQSDSATIELDVGGSTGPSALLYDELGDNTDGALTQKKSTEELNKKVEFEDEGFTEDLPTIQTQIDSLNSEIEELRKLLSVSSLPLGTIISSAIMQGSSSLHLLDGGELSIGGTYDAFCQFVIETYNRDNTSIPVTDLETYQNELSTYGQCGKFVITDTYVKLPKITKLVGGIENISDLAKINEAGLPNITGEIGKLGSRNTGTGPFFQTANGAFKLKSVSGNIGYDTDSVAGTYNFNTTFDASLSNPIYGKSSTVETEYLKYPYYIVVATVTKTDIEVNLDNVATDLNNKADKTGANIDKVEFNKNLQNDWINKYLRAVSSASNTSWITVDLYSYLDNTDGLFEVFVNIYLYNNVNANSAVYMYTDCIGDSTNYVETHYEWKYDTSRDTFIVPVKRYLYIRKAQHNSGDSFRVDCFGYRRIK